jgi:hypothetical protein
MIMIENAAAKSEQLKADIANAKSAPDTIRAILASVRARAHELRNAGGGGAVQQMDELIAWIDATLGVVLPEPLAPAQ